MTTEEIEWENFSTKVEIVNETYWVYTLDSKRDIKDFRYLVFESRKVQRGWCPTPVWTRSVSFP